MGVGTGSDMEPGLRTMLIDRDTKNRLLSGMLRNVTFCALVKLCIQHLFVATFRGKKHPNLHVLV